VHGRHEVVQLLDRVALVGGFRVCEPVQDEHTVQPTVVPGDEVVLVAAQPLHDEVLGLDSACIGVGEFEAEGFVLGVVPGERLREVECSERVRAR